MTERHAGAATAHARVGRTRAWLEIMRISNLPTVASNAIAGAWLGVAALIADRMLPHGTGLGILMLHDPAMGTESPFFEVRVASVCAILAPLPAYLGGMVLNDAFDAEVDARERPARPIPSGRISRTQAFVAGFALLALSLGLAAASGAPVAIGAGVLLVACIVLYDCVHTKSILSTLLLACCRALAAGAPMLATADGDIEALARHGALVLPIVLAAWTLGLSIVARGEARDHGLLKGLQSSKHDLKRDRSNDSTHDSKIDASAAATRSANGLRCIRCGHSMLDAAHICPECGRSSSHATRLAHAERQRDRRSMVRAGATVIGSLLAALGFMHTRKHLDPTRWIGDREAGPLWFVLATVLLIAVAFRAHRRMRQDPRATPQTIAAWIACLALLDACALAAAGNLPLAVVCVALFGVTRLFQRRVAGS